MGDSMSEDYGFTLEKQRAVERMRELNARAKYKHNASASTASPQHESSDNNRRFAASQADFHTGINIPFLSDLTTDSDISLILGLALLLLSEKSDKLLLLALLYILI